MITSFKTISRSSEGLFRDRGSKFIAYCQSFDHPDDLKSKIESIKKIHPKAHHYCFAYRLGVDKHQYRYSDDGEPSGTGGKPILGAIDRNDLTDLIIIVVRYFGGTKLGTSGLIPAYRNAALEAIRQNNIVEKPVLSTFEFSVSYRHSEKLLSVLSDLGCKVIQKSYREDAHLKVEIPSGETERIISKIKAVIGNLHLEELNEDTQIEGLIIKQIG